MSASEQIDEMIAGLTDWRGTVFARIRAIILKADPAITEEVKWRGAPVWSHDGNVCLAAAFKGKVKVTFPSGAMLPDPDKLFNAELEGKQWRAIDILENDTVDEKALKAMVRAAAEFNHGKSDTKAGAKPAAKSGARKVK
jgi:hypothetical protein